MKRLFNLIVVFVLCFNTLSGQVFDVTYSTTETNVYANLIYTARNSVTLGPGYSYTHSGGGTLDINIQNPIVTGTVSYNATPIDPENRTLNTSYLVGATNGSLNVNPMGGASYSIPLELLPGVNGLAPGLSLVYSSNSGPGLVGYGWQIAGLSAISRGPKNYYNDNKVTSIAGDTTDRFYLDGQRLVTTTSNAYGTATAEYQTENDIFTRVKPYGTDINAGYFKAETKSGLIFEYGYTDDSKQKVNANQVLNWCASKVTDLFGNQLNINYINDNYSIYPAEIKYGPNTITFYYKIKSDQNSYFLNGTKIVERYLLNKITVKYNSTIVKTYEFAYNNLGSLYNSYSILNEVIEYGIDGTSRLNSTAITYQIPSNVAISQTMYNTTHGYVTYKSRMCGGDFNGDGKTDFLCLPDVSKQATWTGMQVYYGDGNDNFNFGFSETTSLDLTQLKDIRSLDLNGDGKDDILYEYGTSTSTFKYMLFDGSSFTNPTDIIALPYDIETGLDGKRRRTIALQEKDNEISGADFNGDGVNDIFINNPVGHWEIRSFVNSSGQITSTLNSLGSGTDINLSKEVISADFNGDGKSDLWCNATDGLHIYTLMGTTLTQLYFSAWPYAFTLGDFNADGKADAFLYGTISGGTISDMASWQIMLSTGTGFEQKSIPQKKANMKDDYIRMGDFNGDGATDLMVNSPNLSWLGTYLYLSMNGGTDLYTYNVPGYPPGIINFYLGDYNGDGNTDFVCTDRASIGWDGYKVYKTIGNNSFLMDKVGNGLGYLTKLTYTKLSQAPASVYQRGTTAIYPVIDSQEPITVVSSIQSDNGKGTMNIQNYYYEGLKIHLRGKGVLGYSKTRVTDVATGIDAETSSGYSTTYFYPQLLRAWTKRTGTTDTIAKATNTWNQKVLDASRKRIFPYIQKSLQTNKLTGQSVIDSIGYDNYGNPTPIKKRYSNGPTITTTHTYTNIISATQWLLGRATATSIQVYGEWYHNNQVSSPDILSK